MMLHRVCKYVGEEVKYMSRGKPKWSIEDIQSIELSKVIDDNGCWNYSGCKQKYNGYGVVMIGGRKGKRFYTHRLYWEKYNGPIPDDLHVLHKCDNPACINPDHLFLGTHKENMEDMIAKGRAAHQKLLKDR